MKPAHDRMDSDEGSMALQESFECGEFELGECLVPLKKNELPKTNNTLRNVTQNTKGPLPPSPAILKRKNSLTRLQVASPMDSPGSLRSSLHNPLGGSLHGRGSSPGPLGGRGPGGKSRTRSNSPKGPLVRSRSPGPLGGSLHNRTSSPTPLLMVGPGGLPLRRRSNSPGSLKSTSLHGTSSLRPRSRSPGAFQGRNRSFRFARRMSAKCNKGPTGLVSILRKGKFSGGSTTATAAPCSSSSSLPIPPPPPASSPPASPAVNSCSSHHRKRLLGGRRVTFWFPDEQSLACSFATEESMAFAELGFDDSGEGFGCEEEYGLRTIRGGELPFIEVMGDNARGRNDDDDDDDYLVKRFNGSTIHEELGASFGEGNFTSFSSLLSDESEEDHHDNQKEKGPATVQPKEQVYSRMPEQRSAAFDSSQDDWSGQSSQGSFALSNDVIDKTKKSKDQGNNKYHESFCVSQGSFALPDMEEDMYAPCKKNMKTKKNKNIVIDDSDDDQGSFALPDLDEDDGIPTTKRKTNQSKKTKVKDKDSKDDGEETSSLPDLAGHDGSHKQKTTTKKKKTKDKTDEKQKDKTKEKKKDKDKYRTIDAQESLGVSQGSFALPDLEEDIISHKKTKKDKIKDVEEVEDHVSQDSFALPDDPEEDIVNHKKTKKDNGNDVQDNEVDRQESFGASQGSLALPDIREEPVMHKTNKKSNPKETIYSSNKKAAADDNRQESFGENQDSFVSLVFEEDDTLHKTNKSVNKVNDANDDDQQESLYASQGSFALPDSMDSSSLTCSPYHQFNHRSRNRQQQQQNAMFCQLPRTRRRNLTPPPNATARRHSLSRGSGGAGGAGSSSTLSSSSLSSSLRLEEAMMTPVRQKTPQQQQQQQIMTATSPWCCSESSLELSALRDSSKSSNRDSLSETSSSESPTSVTELGGISSQIGGVGGEENGLNPIPVDEEEDTEHRRLTVKRSMVSTLVPPIG